MGILSEFIHWLPAYFFPKICYGCGKEGLFVCPDCRPKVAKAIDLLICPNCQKQSPLGITHPECKKTNGLDGLISYYRYSGWAKEIVKDAKFGLNPHWRAMKELAEEFAEKLAIRNSLSATREESTAVVPVPLHWFRKMKRGFNQAEIIAKSIAESLDLPLKTDLIERSTYSLPQTLVRDRSRRTNVKKAFSVNSEFPARSGYAAGVAGGSIQYSELNNVLLVDDVWTSGATMKECCRTLKSAGVKKVWGITLLRA